MASVAPRISLLTNIFMGAASAHQGVAEGKQAYVRRLLQDLLCTEHLPAAVREQLANFDPQRFDLTACAADFEKDPPMSNRRLLELTAYIALVDGEVGPEESEFIHDLGHALRMAPSEYADLVAQDTDKNSRESFIELARVPLNQRSR